MKIGEEYFCENCHIKLDGDFEGENSHIAMCPTCEEPHHFCTECAIIAIPDFGNKTRNISKEEFEKFQREIIPPNELLNIITFHGSFCNSHKVPNCNICSDLVISILRERNFVLFVDKEKTFLTHTNSFLDVCYGGHEAIESFKNEIWSTLEKIHN